MGVLGGLLVYVKRQKCDIVTRELRYLDGWAKGEEAPDGAVETGVLFSGQREAAGNSVDELVYTVGGEAQVQVLHEVTRIVSIAADVFVGCGYHGSRVAHSQLMLLRAPALVCRRRRK